MLAIARALVQSPKLLLIDEMSMGLAPVAVESLMPVIRRVADEHGASVIMVEQHVQLALEVADEAMVLVHGSIVLSGLGRDSTARHQRRSESAYMSGSIISGLRSRRLGGRPAEQSTSRRRGRSSANSVSLVLARTSHGASLRTLRAATSLTSWPDRRARCARTHHSWDQSCRVPALAEQGRRGIALEVL